jgi:hypothetical protein
MTYIQRNVIHYDVLRGIGVEKQCSQEVAEQIAQKIFAPVHQQIFANIAFAIKSSLEVSLATAYLETKNQKP